MFALGYCYSILTLSYLDYVSARVSHSRVILDSKMLKGIDETALHVSALLSPHRSIHKPLSSTHCVEEELYRIQPVSIAVIDEAPRRSSHVSRFEEAEGSSSVSPQDSLSSDGLLAHVCSHLSNIERRASGARPRHYDSAVVHLEVLVCVISRDVARS